MIPVRLELLITDDAQEKFMFMMLMLMMTMILTMTVMIINIIIIITITPLQHRNGFSEVWGG